MPRRHHRQGRRRVLAIAAIALVAAGCSGSGDPESSETTPTVAPETTIAPTTTAPSLGCDTTAAEPVITTRTVTGPGGKAAGVIASIEGRGDATIKIPARIGVPAIVHAQHDCEDGRFAITTIDPAGRPLGTPAQSVGAYGGTFPIGFVDQSGAPTSGLQVETDDAWHLDIAKAVLTPPLTGAGVSGHGDAVLSYAGPEVSAHVTSSGRTPFTIRTFDRGVTQVLASTIGPYDAQITLPKGPAFISVTATGDWSMNLR